MDANLECHRSGNIRIALITPSLRVGGLERMIRDLAIALRERDYECQVFVMYGLGVYADSLARAGIPYWDCKERWPRVPGLPTRLLRALRRFRPSIIHSHSGTWFPASVAKLTLGSPRLIFTDHGRYTPEPRYRSVVERKFFYRQTDKLIAVSADLADYLKEFLKLAAPPDVIENGIDLAQYQGPNRSRRSELRAEWGVTDDEVLAIAVGRLERVKNHAGMLEALTLAAKEVPRLRLAILGSGRLRESLMAQAVQSGLEERVSFLGYRDDVAACLAAADLFVSASTTEGLPVALLEALATGLPVVATGVGGIPDALGVPPPGAVVAAGDMKGLAAGLVELAMDSKGRERLGAQAAERARLFSLERCASRYCTVYGELLA